MPSDDNQRNVFNFLLDHLDTKEPFSKHDLEAVTTWHGQTFNTYWSKQLKPLVIEVTSRPRLYRVHESFRRYDTWEKFQRLVTQVRGSESVHYNKVMFDKVRIYEFFMPLTNENYLRTALDVLFYKDTIESRLRSIDSVALRDVFPQQERETDEEFMNRLFEWIGRKFVGYSIYHVNGRFRNQDLATRTEVGQRVLRYLADETTAVTRFIFPCDSEAEANQVEFFFTNLFVQAIIDFVNGEAEIWMVESGMRNSLHIWKVDNQ